MWICAPNISDQADGLGKSLNLLWFYFGRSLVHFILIEIEEEEQSEAAIWLSLYYMPKWFLNLFVCFNIFVLVAMLVGASCSHSPTAEIPL